MATFDLSPVPIRELHGRRNAVPPRPRPAVVRKVATALLILGLGIAIGVVTATFEIDRQERAARVAR